MKLTKEQAQKMVDALRAAGNEEMANDIAEKANLNGTRKRTISVNVSTNEKTRGMIQLNGLYKFPKLEYPEHIIAYLANAPVLIQVLQKNLDSIAFKDAARKDKCAKALEVLASVSFPKIEDALTFVEKDVSSSDTSSQVTA